jgi:flagellar biosynthesis/type III secretory pathway protein FliH
MSPKILKRGTAGASKVQQFLFLENPAEEPLLLDQPPWPDYPPSPNVLQKRSSPEAPAPAVDLAQLEKNAFEDGYRKGEKAGKEIAEKKIDEIMKRYAEAIFEVGKLKPSLYTQVEREVVKLAIEVAKKIVHREIQADRDIIQTLVRVALSHVAEKSAVTVHINPIDHSYLMEQRVELSQTEGRDITLLADKSIERGGCLIKTECGDIDARIEEKFREVEHAFFQELK